jgi:hypothetical protein
MLDETVANYFAAGGGDAEDRPFRRGPTFDRLSIQKGRKTYKRIVTCSTSPHKTCFPTLYE